MGESVKGNITMETPCGTLLRELEVSLFLFIFLSRNGELCVGVCVCVCVCQCAYDNIVHVFLTSLDMNDMKIFSAIRKAIFLNHTVKRAKACQVVWYGWFSNSCNYSNSHCETFAIKYLIPCIG